MYQLKKHTASIWLYASFLFYVTLLCAPIPSCAFYVPGAEPVDYQEGDTIEIKAVKMTSSKTQLPYDYYSLPFCQPEGGPVYDGESLGKLYIVFC